MRKQWNERGFHLFWVIEEEVEEGATKGEGNRLGRGSRGWGFGFSALRRGERMRVKGGKKRSHVRHTWGLGRLFRCLFFSSFFF